MTVAVAWLHVTARFFKGGRDVFRHDDKTHSTFETVFVRYIQLRGRVVGGGGVGGWADGDVRFHSSLCGLRFDFVFFFKEGKFLKCSLFMKKKCESDESAD